MYDGTIFTSQANGGIVRYFCNLIEEMARIRPDWIFDVHVVNDGKAPARLPSGDNIRISSRRYFRPAWCCVALNYGSRQMKIRTAKPSILHSTLGRPFHFPGCPTVVTVHDAILEKVPEVCMERNHSRERKWWRWSATHADAVLTVSHTSRSDIVEIWSTQPSKVHVTYPGVEETFFKPTPKEVSSTLSNFGIGRPYVLYVGHRGEHKNFALMAEAMRSPALSGIDLVFVGGVNTITEMPGRLQTEAPRQRHLRQVSDQQLRDLYAGSVALVFPSIYEGFGFPLVEAMRCGAPVVASDIPSSREICGEAAEFFPARSPTDCAMAIKRVQDRERRCWLVRQGTERAKRFCWSLCAGQTIQVYEQLICEPVRRDH